MSLLIVLLLSLLAAPVRAVWPSYSPFDPAKPPAPFAHTVLKMVRRDMYAGDPIILDFFRRDETTPCLKVHWADEEEGGRVQTFGPDGTVQFSTWVDGSPVCDTEAVVADLNGDAQTDYIVVTHSGGNGLAGQITFVTFLLSSPAGLVVRTVFSFDAAAVDLVDLDHDGRPEFVHGMFVGGDTGRDGRPHNYWVYNLVGFSGTNLVSANGASAEFPKWVMYTFKPNHRDSDQLTAAQRERRWLAAWEGWRIRNQQWLAAGGGKNRGAKQPLFPAIEDFAAEQGRSITKR